MNELKRIEREQKLELLKSTVVNLDQVILLDSLEHAYADGAKIAVQEGNWIMTYCDLVNLETHIKEKLDVVHKLVVQVKRETRRRK